MKFVKNPILIFAIYFVSYSNICCQFTTKWEVVNSVSKDCNFYSGKKVLDYCDKEHVVALGRYTTNPNSKVVSNQVLKYNISSNAIKTLLKDTIHLTDKYESIAYPTEDVIACVGSTYDTIAKINHQIYKKYYGILNLSVDSGNTWQRLVFDSNTTFIDISMLDSKTGLILQQSQNNYYNKFETTISTLLYTNDCWKTYRKIELPKDKQYFNDLSYITSEKIYLLGWDITLQNYLYYSSDMGVTWETLHVFDKNYNTKTFSVFNENNIGLFLNREFNGTTFRIPYFYRSSNGGVTWDIPWDTECKNIGGSSIYSSIDYYDSLNIIISFLYTLYRTGDGGKTWLKEDIPNEYVNYGIIKQVIYPDTNISLLVTTIGNILVNKNQKILAKPEIITRNSWSNEYLNNLEIKWKSIDGATKYRVIYNGTKKDSMWLTDFNYMMNPICDTIVNDTSFFVSKLEEKYQYTVWVKAIGDNIESEWSTGNRFYTDSLKNGLLQPFIITPLQDSWVKDSLVTLVWNKVPHAESYDIYISNNLNNFIVEKLDIADTALNDLYFPPHDYYKIKIRSRTRDYSKYSTFSTIHFYRWYSLNETYIEDIRTRKDNVHIYPNPAKDYCFISFDSEISDKSKIEIYTITRTIVYSESLDIFTGRNNIPVDLRMFPSGFYTVQILNGNDIKYGAFIK